jgi:hypothetical protein
MAYVSRAGNLTFMFENANRAGSNPPLAFPDYHYDAMTELSICIWVKANTYDIPTPILNYTGTNGSSIYFSWDGRNWRLEYRNKSVVVMSHIWSGPGNIGSTPTPQWYPFCFTLGRIDTRGGLRVYLGTTGLPNDPDNPKQMVLSFTFPFTPSLGDPTDFYDFNFYRCYVGTSPHVSICNFKVWNRMITDTTEMTNQVNKWDTVGDNPAPIWASAFRTADTNNTSIIYRKSSPYWNAEHTWNNIDNGDNLNFDSLDPEYLAKHQACPTWLYPLNYGVSNTIISYDLALTPTVPTIYKSDQFFRVQDVGSIDMNGTLAGQGILYFGYPTNDGTGVGQVESYGLWKDETGAEVSDTTNKFEDDTLVGSGGVTIPKLYQWSFGAQFKWNGQSPQVNAAMAMLINPFVMCTYIGYPTGQGALPYDDLTGLFAIQKGSLTDMYYRGTELKIPDPTIRTALIGE